MNYRGTIAYRTGLGGNVPEGFLASVVPAWDFLKREFSRNREVIKSFNDGQGGDARGNSTEFHFMRGMSCMLHDSANQIAEGFLGDWVLMLDTDHVFKSDAFYEMVTTFESGGPDGQPLDILVGFAQKRQPPYLPLIMKTNFDPLQRFEPIIPKVLDRHQLMPIDAAGLACTMIRRDVFDEITYRLDEKPFDFRKKFSQPSYVHSSVMDRIYYEGYTPQSIPKDRRYDEFYWEDISFFWRAALLGYKAYCAPWIKFHHIETRLVTDDMIQQPKESPIPQ